MPVTTTAPRTTAPTTTTPGGLDWRAVPWRAPFAGFAVGFVLALLPATFVARVVPSLLPLVAKPGRATTALIALLLAACAGLATAVCCAARDLRT